MSSSKVTPWLQNPKVHHRIQNRLLPAPILSQLNPLHTHSQSISPSSILIPSAPRSSEWSLSFALSLCVMFRNKLCFMVGFASPPPNPQAGGLPPVCDCLFSIFIRSYPPYLQTVSSVRSPRSRHAVVTGYALSME
jgi:hypothetical protein